MPKKFAGGSTPIQATADKAVRDHYDRIPYPAAPRPLSHPDRLATLAYLHGLDPQPIERCRVLELACADGGNILAMAANYPNSSFLGVDVSPVQIAQGRERIARLGLKNIELMDISLLDLEEKDGPFDYIIAHGVFSWVRPEVQDKILHICRHCLAPNGVSYISYNVYPGWYSHRMMRDLMAYRTRNTEDPGQRVEQSAELIRFMSAAAGQSKDASHARFIRTFRTELESVHSWKSYLFHEYLEEVNAPMYFHQFMDQAHRAGLQYLSDADPVPHEPSSLPDEAIEVLQRWCESRVEVEQYVDFIRNCPFRQSLLCRSDTPMSETIDVHRVRDLYASSAVTPVDTDKEDNRTDALRFRVPSTGDTFTAGSPATAQLLLRLGDAWPRTLSFKAQGECSASGASPLVAAPDDSALSDEALADMLLSLFLSGIISLHRSPVRCAAKPSDHPCTSPLARLQCAEGLAVTNQRHHPVDMDDDTARFLLPLLDGTRNRAALTDCLEGAVRNLTLMISSEGRPIQELPQARAVLEKLVGHHLAKMAEHALLVE